MYSKPFRFTEDQARIVAKWEIGVRNAVRPLAAVLFAAIIVIEIIRRETGISARTPGVLIAEAAAIAVFVFALYYIGCRVDMTAREIAKRTLAVDFNDEGCFVAMIEYSEKIVFRADHRDIIAVDMGENVLRIEARSGAICLPRDQVPESFITLMQKQLGQNSFKIRKWM